ncbi:MAG: hypothetical protein LUC43_07840 [Burkholderiales bacterium]|nr:hypothetical protein [Burkholderiales bacterium]
METNAESNVERRAAIKDFVNRWKDKGKERAEAQKFWLDLLQSLFGLQDSDYIVFEQEVKVNKNTNFIDARIPSTKVLIEQKGRHVNLSHAYGQSDKAKLTPFEQALRYNDSLPHFQKARWIVVSNFQEFHIHDLDKKKEEWAIPEIVKLSELENESHLLRFLVDNRTKEIIRETEISVKAGELVGKLYDMLLKGYGDDALTAANQQSLNKLCVRLVFCLYAEDAFLFGPTKLRFHDFLKNKAKPMFSGDEGGPQRVRDAIVSLFKILDTPEEKRDKYGDQELLAFPYVDGKLFAGAETSTIPRFSEEAVTLLLDKASAGFDWKDISPTIFGAVFESTLNPETRRSGGMHYTSIQNIRKVIDPLFMDGLREEFNKIKSIQVEGRRRKALLEFQTRLGSLKFLDPACGSGNFLTETYLELRKLENEVLRLLLHGQASFGEGFSPIKVHLEQFYGIEINDFAVSVAQTALWIAESQMLKETEDLIQSDLEFLPLKSSAHIYEGNALRMDWSNLVSPNELSYIMGNPPFVGGMLMTPSQKDDMWAVLKGFKGVGELDYVAAWYKKAADYIGGWPIQVAFVSTNSITQGQQATCLWQPLAKQDITLNFAYRTFRWDSEMTNTANVHCVIVGFSRNSRGTKLIYDKDSVLKVDNINQYLLDAPTEFIISRKTPICNVPKMAFGNMPRDGGGFVITDEERLQWLKQAPGLEPWIRPYIGSHEFINNKKRWCLWLVGAPPNVLRHKLVKERLEKVRQFRLDSKAEATRKFSSTPSLFCQISQPNVEYLLVPAVSSERRLYVPMGFEEPTTIASNLVQLVPGITVYHFGVLTSSIHMAWMRTVAGRLKSDYRYSKDIVYNNFIWPTPTDKQKEAIEKTAKAILDIRAKFPESSLADLYDPLAMPPELLKAHENNDKAVLAAYDLKPSTTEEDMVTHLFQLYGAKVEEIEKSSQKENKETEESSQ